MLAALKQFVCMVHHGLSSIIYSFIPGQTNIRDSWQMNNFIWLIFVSAFVIFCHMLFNFESPELRCNVVYTNDIKICICENTINIL